LVKDLTIYNNPANPFTQPIPTEAALHPQSANYISHLQTFVTRQSWWNHDWSVPIFYADMSNAPNKKNIAVGEGSDVFHGQRLPACTTGQIAGEGHVIVVNTVEGCMQHIWGFNVGSWPSYPHAFGAFAQPKDFDATWRAQGGLPSRFGPTASGLAFVGVWPDELTSVIPRGQKFVIAKNHNKTTAVDPANHADGIGTHQYDMEQGYRIRLNPNYDISHLKMYERVYGQALKTYGAVLNDSNAPNSNVMGFSGPPSKASCVNNFFADMFPDDPTLETNPDILLHYDLGQFQLMPTGAPVTVTPELHYSTYCGTYNNNPIAVPAPTLSSISPSTAAAGSTVTLTGTNLTGAYHVIFGTADAWNPTVVSSTQVRCVVPAGSGTVAVKLRTGGGTTGTVSFTYGTGGTPPTLSGINPTSGATAGGTACTLTGAYLTGCNAVSFGGTAATGISVVSSTQVRCTSPAKSAGTISVTATTPNGTSGGVNYTYTGGDTYYTNTLNAVADSFVRLTDANKNWGTTTNIIIQKNLAPWNDVGYFKFDLGSVQGTTITSAKFRFYRFNGGAATTVKAYSCATDTWIESGTGSITWNNKPAWGTQQATMSLPSTGWGEATLTSYINANFNGDKLVTIVLMDDANLNINVQGYSDEASSNKPALVVISQ